MNKTVTQFVFAAALLVAMLAATGIAQAQEAVNFQGVPGNNDIRISWMKPATGGTTFSYFVTAKPTDGTTVNFNIPATNAGSFDYSVNDLLPLTVTNGKTYRITVRPKPAGDGNRITSFISVTAGAPLAPTNFTSTGFADAVVLTWTAPASNGAAITEYQIHHYDTGDKDDAVRVNLGGNARTHTLSNRIPGREIILTLTAKNSRGRSAEATYEVTPRGAPVARPSIALAGPDTGSSDSDRITSNRGIDITLASNFDANRDSWEISINDGANYNYTSAVEARSTNMLRFELPDGKYTNNQIRVRQTVKLVRSDFAGLDAFIFDATPPVVTLTSLASITLDVGGTYNEVGATATDILDDNVPKPTTTDTVDTGTVGIYTITYRATDAAGNTGTATRTVTVNPAPPVLRSGAITPTSIVIEWDAVDGATEYKLFRDSNLITTTSELSYTDTGLNPETRYLYAATSTNPAGTSGASNNLILTTTAVEPTLTIERLRDNSLRLTWENIPTFRGFYSIGIREAGDSILYNFVSSPLTIKAEDLDRVNAARRLGVLSHIDSGSGTPTTVGGVRIWRPIPAEAPPLPLVIGPATLSIPENTADDTVLATYTTTANLTTWGVRDSNSPDFGLFNIDSDGRLKIQFLPDYEALRDVGADNLYNITIRAVDDSFQPVAQDLAIAITVTNVDEPGAISAITGDAHVGAMLTAGSVASDPDAVTASNTSGEVSVTPAHQWQSAADGTAADSDDWAAISGATGATYEPVVGDVGRIIRVVATYTGVPGFASQTATSAATAAVIAMPNTPPVADAGRDQTVFVGMAITVNGSASSDPDGDTLTYSWVQTGGTTVALSGATTSGLTFTAPATTGRLTFTLTVTDDGSPPASHTDTVIITVTAAVNHPPMANAGDDQEVATGALVILDGSGSRDPDGDDNALTYSWEHTRTDGIPTTPATAIALTNADTVSPTFPTTTAGVLTFTLTVTDTGSPQASRASTVTITVTGDVASTEATLSALAISPGGLTPEFNSAREDTDYTVTVLNSVASVRITPTVNGDGASVTVNGARVASGQASQAINLQGGINAPINIVVTAEAGNTRTYRITVTRIDRSTDTRLAELAIRGDVGQAIRVPVTNINAVPGSNRLDYTVRVDNDVQRVRVAYFTDNNDASATVDGMVVQARQLSAAIALPAVGESRDIPIVVTAARGGAEATYTLTVRHVVNAAPIIQGNTAPNYNEHDTMPVATYTATDDNPRSAITWSLEGADADFFAMDAGVLSFNDSPNFAERADEDKNDYQVTIAATDNGIPPQKGTRNVTVTLINVEDAGAMGAIAGAAQIGQTLTAGTVTDPDAVSADNLAGTIAVGDITYQWQSAGADNAYTPITGATDSTYLLPATDAGRTLRVVATYTDGFGAETETVTSAPTAAIVAGTAPAPPSIALTEDSGIDDDGITRNGAVVVTLASNFDRNFDTWKYSTDSGTSFIGDRNGFIRTFTLEAGVYALGRVLVVQTVSGVDSAPASIAVTVDQTAPTATFAALADDYVLNRQRSIDVTFSDPVTGFEAGDILVGSEPGISSVGIMLKGTGRNDRPTYTIDFTPITAFFYVAIRPNSVADLAGNRGPAASASTSFGTARPVPPGIALSADTGRSDTDRITMNRGIIVTLMDDFGAAGGFWEYSTDSGKTYTRGSRRHLELPEGEYTDDQVRVRQSAFRTTSRFAGLAAFTIDTTPPSIVRTGHAAIDLTTDDPPYNDEGAIVSDNLDDAIRLVVAGDTVGANFAGIYTITYDAQDAAGNNAVQVTRTVTVHGLGFSAAPVLTSSNDGNYAIAGDILTLTFTVNQALEGDPAVTVTIAGQAVRVENTDNMYTATYRVDATHAGVAGGNGVPVEYDIGAMTAVATADTLDPPAATSTIEIDVVAPTVVFGAIAEGVPNTPQTHDITFSEAVTGFDSSDLAATGATVNSVAPVSGSDLVYTIDFTPTAAVFTLTLNAATLTDPVTDLAGNAVPETAARGTAPEPVSTDATLSGLSIADSDDNQVALVPPTFDSARETYTADVDNGVASVTVTPTTTNDGASVDVVVNDTPPVSDQASVSAALNVGVNNIAIEVTAEDGSQKTYTLTVTRADNIAPVANAGNDRTVNPGGRVFLNGRASNDPDGNNLNLRYVWVHTLTDGTPPASPIDLTHITDRGTFDAPTATGVLTFELTVTDAGTPPATSTADTIDINVIIAPLAFTVAPVLTGNNAANSGYAKFGDELSLTFTTNVPIITEGDAKNGISIAKHFAQQLTKGTGNEYTATYEVDALHAPFRDLDGELVPFTIHRLTATDSAHGIIENRATETSTIRVDITAPRVTTFNAPAAAAMGAVHTPTITFSEPVTGLAVSDFSTSEGVMVTGVTPPSGFNTTYTITFTQTAATFTLTLAPDEVADPAGNTGPPLVPISAGGVPAAGNMPPTVDAGTDQTVNVGASVTLSGTATDPENGALHYAWRQSRLGDAPALVGLTNANRATATFTAPDTPGVYQFTLVVTDAATNQVGDSVVITVVDATLSALAITHSGSTAVELMPTFASDILGYAASLGNDVASVKIRPTLSDTAASVTVAGTVVTSGAESGDISLNPGANPIRIVVTAAGSSVMHEYEVVVTRATNTAPVITRTAGDDAIMVGENVAAVHTYAATDADAADTDITWSLDGTDSSFFTIGATSGVLTFNASPNFEDAADDDGGNDYEITISATDDGTPPMEDTLAITVTVTNVDEPGAIGDITDTAQVGVELTAGTVTDPDGTVTGITYQWQSVESGTTTDIGTDMTYTPGVDDVGRTIQVVATYTDGHAGGKEVTSAATAAVIAADTTTAPMITLLRVEHTDGIVSDGITYLNAGDTLTVFVQSDEPLTAASLVDSVRFRFGDNPEDAQNLLTTATANQYSALYTVSTENANRVTLVIDGVADADNNSVTNLEIPIDNVQVDTTLPIIDLIGGPVTVAYDSDDYMDDGVSGVNTDAGEYLETTIAGPDLATDLDTTVPGDYTYTYTVTDLAGNTDTLTRTVTVSVSPTEPPALRAAGITSTTIDLEWDAQTSAVQYDLYRDDTRITTTSNTSYPDTGLDPETDYTYRIHAVRSFVGVGSAFGSLKVTTTAAPTAPATPVLVLGAVTDTSIEITWGAVTGADSYTLTRIVAGVTDNEEVLPDRLLTFTDTDVTPDTEYKYVIIATNSAGLSSNPSAEFTVRTDATDTTAPTVTLGSIIAGVIGTAQDHDITFDEAVTGLVVGDFSVSNNIVASGDLVVNSVTPASGPSTTYTISITPRATAFILTLAADSVMDTASNTGPATAASAIGSATAGLALNAGADQPDVLENTAVNLEGTITNPGTDPVILWTHTLTNGLLPSTPLTIINPAMAEVSFTTPYVTVDTTLTFELSVTLSGGGNPPVTDTVDIVIPNVAQPRVIASVTVNVGSPAQSTLAVSWTQGSGTDKDPTTGFDVEYKVTDADDNTYADTNVVVTAETAAITGLTADTGYTVRVRAKAGSGTTAEVAGAYVTNTGTTAADTTAPSAPPMFFGRVEIGTVANADYIDLYFQLRVATDNIVFPEAIGGTGDLTYSLAGEDHSLESLGLSFDPATRTLSGTPTLAGAGETESDGFELVYAVDDTASGRDTITVFVTVCEGRGSPDGASACSPPPFAALGFAAEPDDQDYTVGTAVDLTLPAATGGTGTTPRLLYTLTGPADAALPAGLSFDEDSRTLSGTPTAVVAESIITYRVQDAASGKEFDQEFKLTVAAPPALTAPDDQGYTMDTEITDLVLPEASGGTGTLTYTLTGPNGTDLSEVPGLAFTAGTRTLSGTPSAAGITVLTYTVTDANDATATADFTVTVTRLPNTAPVVSGEAAPNYAENDSTPVATYTATDAESNAIAWSVAGTDASFFAIDPTSGALIFNASPDFEDARGATYSITITATETNGVPSNLASAPLAVTVTVTNVDEKGMVFIDGTAQVGQVLTARVTDPDGAVTGVTYQWQSAPSGSTDYTAISGAGTGATYTPVATDEDRTIQVIATYTDGEGSGKTATSAPTVAVIAAGATPAPSIALNMDTGSSASDGITSNGLVNVQLGSDFGTDRSPDPADSWDYSTDDGVSYTNGTNPTSDPLATSITASFDLGSLADATYQLRVRQTIGGVESAPASLQVTLDRAAPTVATFDNITVVGVIGTEQTHTITFSEEVTGFDDSDITATGATVNSVALVSSATRSIYTIDFTPTAATFSLTLAIDSVADLAGNTGPAVEASVTGTATDEPDITAPTVTLGSITEGVIGTAQDHDITFSEAVTGLTVDDFSTSTDVTVTNVSGSGAAYTITFTPTAATFSLILAANSVMDTADTPNTGPATAATANGTATLADKVVEVILSEVARAIADQNISAIAGRVERARTQQNGGSSFNFAGQQMPFNGNGGGNGNDNQSMSSTLASLMNTHASSMEDGTLDMKTLLGNSAFALPLNATDGDAAGGITFWGSGDYRNFGGEDEDLALDWDGDMFSIHLGLDTRITAEAIGGVALSRNEGELETDDTTKKTYDISMTSINPYLGWSNARGEVWMTAGYGKGELDSDDGAGAGATFSDDLSMNTFAIGGNGIVLQRGANTLRLKGEVTQSTLEVDESNSIFGGRQVDVNRARVSLESTNSIALVNGARTERSMELGIRHDGGDGATGTGAELGFGISHVNASGFSVEGKARALLGHDGNANEWGVSGTIKQTAGADGQGWSFALSPGYGDDAGDIQRLWEDGLRDANGNATGADTDTDADTDTAADATRDYAARLDLRIGFGISAGTAPWLGSGTTPGLLTPYTAMTLSNDSNRYRLGIQWKLGNRLDLDLVGEHRDADDDDDTILLKGELRF
ncbi:cadherin-like beta sandwich domain-containing protein [Candidatus Spongiihabitans sp.]|uniref:cadherin-like beta sandwich domain-containing protein n=1 Tax=Candidatus Spongiihabitans sp. TaxID=3101308 RepID=UPI003C7E9E79